MNEVLDKWKFVPVGSIKWKVRGSPKSVWFILWRLWMSEPNFKLSLLSIKFVSPDLCQSSLVILVQFAPWVFSCGPFLVLWSPLLMRTDVASSHFLLSLLLLPARLMLGFMGVTAFLSMWISNTATTAMMVPIVQAVLDQLNGNIEPEPSFKSQRRSVDLHQEHEKSSSIMQTAAPKILENGTIQHNVLSAGPT